MKNQLVFKQAALLRPAPPPVDGVAAEALFAEIAQACRNRLHGITCDRFDFIERAPLSVLHGGADSVQLPAQPVLVMLGFVGLTAEVREVELGLIHHGWHVCPSRLTQVLQAAHHLWQCWHFTTTSN